MHEDGENAAVVGVVGSQTEFGEDIPDVLLDRAFGHHDGLSDGGVVVTLGHEREHFAFNVMGGVAWATVFTVIGYAVGASFRHVEAITGPGSWVVGGIVIASFVIWSLLRRRRAASRAGKLPAGAVDDDGATEATCDSGKVAA